MREEVTSKRGQAASGNGQENKGEQWELSRLFRDGDSQVS
jgi:hypothetical protein